MKTDSKQLIDSLKVITLSNIEAAKGFKQLSNEILNFKHSPDSWSILECFEHLNRYSKFYLPKIEEHLKNSTVPKPAFKSGIVGNYLVKMVVPGNTSKKMKTFAGMNPRGSNLNSDVITTFMISQHTLLKQLEKAEKHNLNSKGIPVTFTPLIKLNLGDTLRFMAYHNLRHVQQALRNVDEKTL